MIEQVAIGLGAVVLISVIWRAIPTKKPGGVLPFILRNFVKIAMILQRGLSKMPDKRKGK